MLIANECIKDRKMCGRNEVIHKLDLEKAYDCVNLNFLDYILFRMSLWTKWRSSIFYCI